MAPKTDVIEQLRARIAELEEEILIERSNGDHWRDAYSKWVNTDESARRLIELQGQLAAEQLNNKLLREALEAVIKVHGYKSGIPVEALSTRASTEAFDKYVAEKANEAYLNAQRAHAQFEAGLTRQRDLAVEALKWLKLIFTDSEMSQERNPELWMPTVEEAIKESDGK